jgi:YVTN family beta-propeller protein
MLPTVRTVPLLAALAVALAAAACGSSTATHAAPAATAEHGITRITTGHMPCATLGAAGAVWVADFGDNAVRRIDPSTLKVGPAIRTGAQPCGLAYGAGSVWVEDYGDSTVTRIDPTTSVTRSYRVGKSPYDVTFAFGAAWTSNYADDTVSRIDAGTGKVTSVGVGSQPVGIAHAGSYIWVANQGDGTVSTIDPVDLRVHQVTIGGQPAWTGYDGDQVWVGTVIGGVGQSVQIDAKTRKVLRHSTIGPSPNDPDILGGGVWYPDKNGSLYRVGEQDGAVTGPWKLGATNPFVASAFDGRLWIADFGGTDVDIVDPARLPPP